MYTAWAGDGQPADEAGTFRRCNPMKSKGLGDQVQGFLALDGADQEQGEVVHPIVGGVVAHLVENRFQALQVTLAFRRVLDHRPAVVLPAVPPGRQAARLQRAVSELFLVGIGRRDTAGSGAFGSGERELRARLEARGIRRFIE